MGSFINLIKNIYSFKKIKIKLASVEALTVAISSIFALLPWNGSVQFTDSTLIFTPILALMVCCNVSSFQSIHLSTTMLLGTFTASLYVYLIVLITNDTIWITFITTFILFYIVTTIVNIPGRKWLSGLFLKKMYLDIFILLFFTPLEFIQNDIKENIYSNLFIVGSVVISQIVFPSLASRVLFRKVIKSMNHTRSYFKLVGYQFDEKLVSINNDNNNPRIDININGTTTIINRKQTFSNQMFNQIENQLIKEQRLKDLKINESFNGPRTLNISSQQSSQSFSTIQDMPINLKPLLTNSSIHSQQHIIDDDDLNEEKLKLPLSRSNIIHKKDQSFVLDIGKHRSKTVSAIKMNNLQTIGNTDKKSTFSTPILNEKIKIIRGNGLSATDEELEILEVQLASQIEGMTSLFIESKGERWNDSLNENYDQLITKFEMTLKQLISIKTSIKGGFSQVTSQEFISPLIPFIECLVEEVYLQMGIMIDILGFNQQDLNDGSVFKLLNKSFDETIEMVNRVRGAFKQIVDEYQKSGNSLLNNDEVTKVHFFVHGILSFALQQHDLADLLIKVKRQQRLISVRWELIRFGLLMVLYGFPLFIIKRFKFIKGKLFGPKSKSKSDDDTDNDEDTVKKDNNLILLFKWINFHFFTDGKWRFPIQMAVAMISSSIVFHYFDMKTDPSGKFITYGVWTVTTVLFVIGESVGSTLTKGLQECTGTIIGAIVGFLTSLLCSIIPTPWKEIVIVAFIFIFIFIFSFPHQIVKYSQLGEIIGLTFLLVLLGQNLTKDFDYMFSVLRTLHIIFGIVWNILVGLIVFPYFTFKTTRRNIFKSTNSMSDTFIKIIETGLRMNEPINDNSNQELILFNHDGDDLQQSNDLIEKRKLIIIKILSNYGNTNNIIDNNNNVNNSINNIIDIPNNKKESIKLKRIKKSKQIIKSLRSIRIGIDQIKGSLIDVQSELFFISHSKSFKYISIIENLNNCLTSLVALENSFGNPIFSDLLILSMFNLSKPLNDIFQQLNKSKFDLKLLKIGKLNNNDSTCISVINQHCNSIKDKFELFQQSFKSTRLFLLNEHVFHLIHPEQIQFGSGIHIIELFIQSYLLVLQDLHSIRETSIIKQYFNLN